MNIPIDSSDFHMNIPIDSSDVHKDIPINVGHRDPFSTNRCER